MGKLRLAVLPTALLLAFASSLPASAASGDTLVTKGSPPAPFSENKQNEPALAVDANPASAGAWAAVTRTKKRLA